MRLVKYIFIFIITIAVNYPILGQINVAVIGNSIAHGAFSTNPYSDQLKYLLGNNYNIKNYGVDGAYIFKNGVNSYWYFSAYDNVSSQNWDFVIILFGTNESFPNDWYTYGSKFYEDYSALIQELNKFNNPNRKFILLLPPPIISHSSFGDQMEYHMTNAIIPQIKTIAQNTNSFAVDVHDPMLNHPEWYADGIHPNDQGHSFIAQTLYNTILSWPPFTPTGFSIWQKGDNVHISWNSNREIDLTNYFLFRNSNRQELVNNQGLLAEIQKQYNIFSFTNYSTKSESYYYGVKAVDATGNQSPMSAIINFTVNSRPVTNDTTLVLYEDSDNYLFKNNDIPFSDADQDSLKVLKFIETNLWDNFFLGNQKINSAIDIDIIANLMFLLKENEFGINYANFSYHITDSFGSTSLDTNIVYIDVLPVNDEPNLSPIEDLYIMEDSHDILLPINGINSGAFNEDQYLSIEVISSDTSLINVSDIQYTSPDTSGYVTINPTENVYGSRPITIRVWDDGGTENGGKDYTDESFYLYITPTNDPPSLRPIENIILTEDTDASLDITGITAGPWEINQNISISVVSDNTDILPTPTLTYFSPDTFATLTFTTIPNANGNTSITLTMSDDGGTENGGKDSTTYTIPVEIVGVNDKPSDFTILSPNADSTLVIDKHNFNDTFLISWNASEDIDNDKVYYDIIFDDKLSELTRIGVESTEIEYNMKEILAATDTVFITNDVLSIISYDNSLETIAVNSGMSLAIDGRSFAPASLSLDQNHPNPFNHNTLIGFDLPKRSKVSLTIFDLLGKEIVKLVHNEYYERGYGTINWNGLDANLNHIPTGIYFMQINVNGASLHKKLLLLK